MTRESSKHYTQHTQWFYMLCAVFTGFSKHSYSIYNIIPLLKKKCVSPILLGRHSPGGDHVLCRSTDVTTRDIRLIDRAITMTS